MSIRDCVHSGWCPFGMVSIRDCVHSGLCTFGIVSIRDCVHSGLCPFGIVSIRDCAHSGWCPFGMVSIRDGVHSGWCPFGIVSIRDGVHSGLCPFGIVSIRDCVHSGLCPSGLCLSGLCPFGQLSGYRCPIIQIKKSETINKRTTYWKLNDLILLKQINLLCAKTYILDLIEKKNSTRDPISWWDLFKQKITKYLKFLSFRDRTKLLNKERILNQKLDLIDKTNTKKYFQIQQEILKIQKHR